MGRVSSEADEPSPSAGGADQHERVGRYATCSWRRSLPTGAVGVGDRVHIDGGYRGEAAQRQVAGSAAVALDDQRDIDRFSEVRRVGSVRQRDNSPLVTQAAVSYTHLDVYKRQGDGL